MYAGAKPARETRACGAFPSSWKTRHRRMPCFGICQNVAAGFSPPSVSSPVQGGRTSPSAAAAENKIGAKRLTARGEVSASIRIYISLYQFRIQEPEASMKLSANFLPRTDFGAAVCFSPPRHHCSTVALAKTSHRRSSQGRRLRHQGFQIQHGRHSARNQAALHHHRHASA